MTEELQVANVIRPARVHRCDVIDGKVALKKGDRPTTGADPSLESKEFAFMLLVAVRSGFRPTHEAVDVKGDSGGNPAVPNPPRFQRRVSRGLRRPAEDRCEESTEGLYGEPDEG